MIEIVPDTGLLESKSDPPERLHAPVFSIELSIDHGWRPMRMLGARWDEETKKFLLSVSYINDSGSAQLCEGKSRILFCGRVVLEFASTVPAFVVPPGAELRDRWPLSM